MSSKSILYCKILRLLFSKIKAIVHHNNQGQKFSHISNLIVTFTTQRLYMTDKYFFKQNKQILEWALFKKSRHYILKRKNVDYGEDIENDK